MTETQLAQPVRFAIGAKVPDWLLTAEPLHTESAFGEFVFDTPCEVIETEAYYVVMPLAFGPLPSILHFTGGGCRVFAPAKQVRIVCAQQVFCTAETDGWAHQLPFIRQTPKVATPKRAWWARLFG